MGLIINKELKSTIGVEIPSGTYMKVNEFAVGRDKEGKPSMQVSVLTFVNKAIRDAGKPPYTIDNSRPSILLTVTQEELETANIYTTIYRKLKAILSSELGEDAVYEDSETQGVELDKVDVTGVIGEEVE